MADIEYIIRLAKNAANSGWIGEIKTLDRSYFHSIVSENLDDIVLGLVDTIKKEEESKPHVIYIKDAKPDKKIHGPFKNRAAAIAYAKIRWSLSEHTIFPLVEIT